MAKPPKVFVRIDQKSVPDLFDESITLKITDTFLDETAQAELAKMGITNIIVSLESDTVEISQARAIFKKDIGMLVFGQGNAGKVDIFALCKRRGEEDIILLLVKIPKKHNKVRFARQFKFGPILVAIAKSLGGDEGLKA